MPENVDIIIKNSIIATMDPQERLFEDGMVAIKDGIIVDVDKTSRIEDKYAADKVIDGKGKIILPGFINTHDHLFQVLMKSLGDDLAILDWWPTAVGPYVQYLEKEHSYYSALLGSVELIKSGVTTILDFQYANPNPGTDVAVLEAWKKLGVRGILGRGYSDYDMWNLNLGRLIEPPEKIFSEVENLIRNWHKKENGRLNVWVAPGAPFTISDETAMKTREFADKYKIGITIHLHESKREVEQWKQQFGTSPLQYYYKKLPEFLGPDMLGVHCVWMDEKDIKIMKEKDIKVSHNTISNMYLASGVAPVPEFLKNGIVVSLGVDGAASNNSQDFMELIKATALLHKVARVDPQAITAKQVLRMATIDGARAVLMENEIGSIEKGKKADIIIFDLNNIQMRPVNNPLSQVVYCGKSWNVETVIVDGNIIMENRVVKGVDEQELIWKVQELADDLVEKAGRTELRKQLWYR